MDRGIPIWGHFKGRHQAAPVLGVRAAVWADQRIGVEFLGTAYRTFRTVELSPPLWPEPCRGRVTVTTVAARLAVAVARSDSREIQSRSGQCSPMQYPLSRRLSVRAAVDAAVYRARLVALAAEDTTSTPLQLDLAPSFGVVVRIP
jgi:hypothetical protein